MPVPGVPGIRGFAPLPPLVSGGGPYTPHKGGAALRRVPHLRRGPHSPGLRPVRARSAVASAAQIQPLRRLKLPASGRGVTRPASGSFFLGRVLGLAWQRVPARSVPARPLPSLAAFRGPLPEPLRREWERVRKTGCPPRRAIQKTSAVAPVKPPRRPAGSLRPCPACLRSPSGAAVPASLAALSRVFNPRRGGRPIPHAQNASEGR